jgi:hypothetical protein
MLLGAFQIDGLSLFNLFEERHRSAAIISRLESKIGKPMSKTPLMRWLGQHSCRCRATTLSEPRRVSVVRFFRFATIAEGVHCREPDYVNLATCLPQAR